MKTLLWFVFAYIALAAAAGFISCSSRAEADHIEPPILPGLPSPVIKRVMEQGYVTYSFDKATADYPNFPAQARDVVEAAQKVIGIPAYYADEKADIYYTMPSDAEFLRVCGKGAAGCILYWSDPIIVYVRQALLYYDWKTTISHEGINVGHAMGQHERYNDQEFKCLAFPNPSTVMSCGSGIWVATEFDRNVVWNLLVPDRPKNLSLTVTGDWATVKWDHLRADDGRAHHGNPQNDNATRMSFGWAPYDGGPVSWVGSTCGERFNYCYSAFKDWQRGFDAYWKGCLYVRAENTALWFIPQVSAPDFWSKAGCW